MSIITTSRCRICLIFKINNYMISIHNGWHSYNWCDTPLQVKLKIYLSGDQSLIVCWENMWIGISTDCRTTIPFRFQICFTWSWRGSWTSSEHLEVYIERKWHQHQLILYIYAKVISGNDVVHPFIRTKSSVFRSNQPKKRYLIYNSSNFKLKFSN